MKCKVGGLSAERWQVHRIKPGRFFEHRTNLGGRLGNFLDSRLLYLDHPLLVERTFHFHLWTSTMDSLWSLLSFKWPTSLPLCQDRPLWPKSSNHIILFRTVQFKKLKKISTPRRTTNSIWNNFEKIQFEKFMILSTVFLTIQFHFQLLSKSLHTVWSTVKLNKDLDLRQIFTTI